MSEFKQTFDDLANLEVEGAEKRVASVEREMKRTLNQIERLRDKALSLDDDLEDAEKALRKARTAAAKLKKSVWSSKDPNIIDLRNQLLLAAKLIKD